MKVHELFGRNIGLEPKMNHLDFKLNSTQHATQVATKGNKLQKLNNMYDSLKHCQFFA